MVCTVLALMFLLVPASYHRIIVPALGAIFGLQLVVASQPTFTLLPAAAQAASFLGMVCTVLALMFLLVPASYHRFTPELDESAAFLKFAQRNVSLAFIVLPLSLALSVFVQAERIFTSPALSAVVALALLALLTYSWWVVPRAMARRLKG